MSPGPIRVPEDFPTIQGAINNATDENKIIVVNAGNYAEDVNVNKSVTVNGMDPDTTKIIGDGRGTVVNITAPDVILNGFTITNGTTGLYIGNTSSNDYIYNNKILSNKYEGIHIDFSTGNTLSNNNMTANGEDFRIEGGALQDFLQTIYPSNTVDGKHMYYWVNATDGTIPLDAGYVALVNCKNITVENLQVGFLAAWSTNITARNLDLTHGGISFISTNSSKIENVNVRQLGGTGILLEGSAYNTVDNNTMTGLAIGYHGCGISLEGSAYNTVYNNAMTGLIDGILMWGDTGGSNYTNVYGNTLKNNFLGVELPMLDVSNCTGNIFYHNNFIDNSYYSAFSQQTGNQWDNGAEGNYWSNKQGVDTDGNGINDAPVNVNFGTGEIDRFPLNETWTPLRTCNMSQTVRQGYPDFTYIVYVLSDHVVASIRMTPTWNSTLTQGVGNVTFKVTSNSNGFCNITIPRYALDGPFEIFADGEKLTENVNYTIACNATYSCVSFVYSQGNHTVQTIGAKLCMMCGDLDGNGKVDMGDIVIALDNFGKHYP
jgi:parallel beta-helix repeat protein